MPASPLPRRDAPFQPGATALLLVDMQRIWLEPGLDPDHAGWGADHYFYRQTRERTIPNQVLLLEAARQAGVEVLHTIIRSLTEDGRDRSLDHKLTPIHVPPSLAEGLPPPELAPVGDEILIPKTSSGVFNSTNIDYLLRNLGVRNLVVAGVLTDQCVDMTVRDAADRGYLVTCVADACAAPTPERHAGALKAFGGCCWVADTVEVATRFRALGQAAARCCRWSTWSPPILRRSAGRHPVRFRLSPFTGQRQPWRPSPSCPRSTPDRPRGRRSDHVNHRRSGEVEPALVIVQVPSFKTMLQDTGTETGGLIARRDWSATSFGAIDGWPQSLKTMLGFVLHSPVPMVMLWGEDGVMLYNDAYSVFAGGRHPQLLGSKVREGWPEVADFNDNVMKVGLGGGTLAYKDQELTLYRHGRPEQVFMNLDYSPVPGDDGEPAGVIAVVIETSARVAAERQREATEAALRAERDRAQGVLDNMGEAFALLDADLRVLDMNAEAMRLEARPRAEVIGRTHGEIHPEADPELAALFRQALRERRAVGLEHRYVWPHGRVTWIEMRAYPVGPGVAVFYRDVTERRQAEEALKASEERFRFALDAAGGIGTWDWDVAADLVFTSASFAEMYGLDAAAATAGVPVAAYVAGIHPDDRAEVGRLIDEAVQGGGEYRAEYRLLGRQGEARWVIARGHCLKDDDGRPARFPGVTFDITDRKCAEERLRRSEARLRFLGEMDESLRASRDAPAAMLAAAGLLARHIGASRCAYADVDADNDRFVIRSDFTAPGIASSAGTYSLDLFGPRAAADMRAGRTLVVRDVAGELGPGEGREMFRAIGIDAIVCCPLVKEGRLVAMMAVHQDRPRDWQEEEVSLVEATVERCWAHVERISAAARLRESEERLRLATEAAEVGFWDVDLVNDVLVWPPRVKAMFGISAGVPVTMRDFYEGLHPEDRETTAEAFAAAADPARRALYDVEYRTVGKEDGLVRWVAAKGRGVFEADGRCLRVVGAAIDVTGRKQIEERLRELNENLERRVEEEVAERAKAEEQLRQAQKMEAVGQLTGGIAHDFNNLLTGVIGSLDMMQRRITKGETDRIERYATAAMTSANRAAALTHRLLAFSRRQPLDPKPVSANRLVTGMEELLRRSIGEAIRLEIVTAGGLWQTRCDPHQLESAILNLAINARDAMPKGGRLTIETGNAHLDSAYAAKSRDVRPGQYVCICVTDTGTGMTPDVIAKAFDPFFTTKPIGQGTGLGLSMIYGFARQSDGYAKIYSEVGAGTTVKLYLPRYHGDVDGEEAADEALKEAHRAEHGEVVVVVEDETAVRDLVVDVLQELGYRAVEAVDGPSGLKLLQSDMRVDLLVTDVGLPGLNGRQVADHARASRPGLKVLFMTGYAENAAVANGFLEPGMQMITKPFAIEALATRIRDMIENG